MAEIISLALYREQAAVRDGFRSWRTLFEEPLDAQTRLSDLGPKTLSYLAEPGEGGTAVLHAMIIGFSGHGAATPFDALDSNLQTRILDVFLFISDQIRFEMMFRLGWLEHFWGQQQPLFKMVTAFDDIKKRCSVHLPALARNHRDYEQYASLIERDQQVFIRRMFSSVSASFKEYYHLK